MSDSDEDLFSEDAGAAQRTATLFGALDLLASSADTPQMSAVKTLASRPAKLGMARRELGNAGVAELASAALAADDTDFVTELDLETNGISDDGVIALADAVSKGAFPRLDKLFVTHNCIESTGLSALAATLPRALALTTVFDMSDNRVGDGGMVALGGAIAKGGLSSLTKLYIARNGIGDAGLVAFSTALCSVPGLLPSLYEFWLSGNMIRDDGAVAFFDALGQGAMARLGDIRMQYNHIGDRGIDALTRSLGAGSLGNAWYLGLSDNAFTDMGLKNLEAAVGSGALPVLEFVSASSDQSSKLAQQAVQDALTARRGSAG